MKRTSIKLLSIIRNKHLLKTINLLCRNSGKPDMLSLHITDKCNLNCSYCYEKLHAGNGLSKEQVNGLLSDAKRNNFRSISFLGGEPFLQKDFLEMLTFANTLRFKIKIFTNGTLLDDKWIDTIKRHRKTSIVVKYDCSGSYKKTVGTDISDQVNTNIKKCTNNGINVFALITINKQNVAYAEKISEKALQLGAFPLMERHIPISSPDLEINLQEWNAALDAYYTALAKHFSVKKRELEEYYISKARMRGYYCPSFISSMSVNIDGSVLPCAISPPRLSIGNILTEGFDTILARYKEKTKMWNRTPAGCKDCKKSDICKGGCKLYTCIKTNGLFSRDPLCDGSRIPLVNC